MAVNIYSDIMSSPCRAIINLCRVAGIEHNVVVTDIMKGDHKKPEYLAINPRGLIPAIKDGDFCLGESAAILRYLCDAKKAPENFLPREDRKKRAIIESLMDYTCTTVRTNVENTFLAETFYAPFFMGKPAATEERVKEIYETKLHPVFKVLEEMLEKTPFLVGEEVSVADLYISEEFREAIVLKQMEFGPFEKVAQWYERVSKIPGVEQTATEMTTTFDAIMKATSEKKE